MPSIPVAGLALILGIDRFMSEARSLTNFVGNGVAAIVVSRWENELTLRPCRELGGNRESACRRSPRDPSSEALAKEERTLPGKESR